MQELRELAHGIYPPLLIDRGLGEALRAAAPQRPAARVAADGSGATRPSVEAAVYFCCVEALQNAAKHGGPGARDLGCGRSRAPSLRGRRHGPGFDAGSAGDGAGSPTCATASARSAGLVLAPTPAGTAVSG